MPAAHGAAMTLYQIAPRTKNTIEAIQTARCLAPLTAYLLHAGDGRTYFNTARGSVHDPPEVARTARNPRDARRRRAFDRSARTRHSRAVVAGSPARVSTEPTFAHPPHRRRYLPKARATRALRTGTG